MAGRTRPARRLVAWTLAVARSLGVGRSLAMAWPRRVRCPRAVRWTRPLAGKVQRLPAGILAAGASLPGGLAALGVPRSGAAGLVRPLRPAAPAGAAVERRPTGAAMPGVARGFHFAPYSRAGGSCTGRGGRNPAEPGNVARCRTDGGAQRGADAACVQRDATMGERTGAVGLPTGAAGLPATAVAPSDTPHRRSRGMPSHHGPEACLRTRARGPRISDAGRPRPHCLTGGVTPHGSYANSGFASVWAPTGHARGGHAERRSGTGQHADGAPEQGRRTGGDLVLGSAGRSVGQHGAVRGGGRRSRPHRPAIPLGHPADQYRRLLRHRLVRRPDR